MVSSAGKRKIFDGNKIFCLAVIIGAACLLSISTTDIPVDTDSLGPFFWPKSILIGLLICGVLKLILSLREENRSLTKSSPAEKSSRLLVVMSVLIVLGYFFGIVYLGYPLASLIFIILFAYLAGVRKYKAIVITSISLTLITSILFVGIMYVSLPRGEGFFNDITNLLFSLLGR